MSYETYDLAYSPIISKKESFLNKSTYQHIPKLPAFSDIKSYPIAQNNDSSVYKLDIIDTNILPNITFTHRFKVIPKLSFSEDIKEEMIIDSNFRKFISEIERGLTLFIESYQLLIEAYIKFEYDWEIIELKNIILYIKFHRLIFKNELKMWKNLSQHIRKILELSSPYRYNGFYTIFTKFYNRFYIKLDLI